MSDTWRGVVPAFNGFKKILVYERKFLPADAISGRPEGYYDCVRIEEPKSTY